MKQPSTAFKRLYRERKPIYTYAQVSIVEKSTGNRTTVNLTPQMFRITGNNYTQSCDSGCPIGNVLSESITLTIANQNKEWAAYDWTSAIIDLSSIIIDEDTTYPLKEGRFYVNSVKYVSSAIEITAFDMISYMNFDYLVNTRNPSSGEPLYSNIWAYFVYLCDTVFASRMGVELTSGKHMYSDRCYSTCGVLMERYSMVAIPPDSKSRTTFRDIMGYIAQTVGGNIVAVPTEGAVPGQVRYVLDIVRVSPLLDIKFYHAGRLTEDIADTYDAGTFSETIENNYIGGETSSTNYNYYVLNNYHTPPELEYENVIFTGVSLEYPVKNVSEYKKITTGTSDNIIALFNPLLEVDTPERYSREQVVNSIKGFLCNKQIRPFDGTFINNPMLEVGDNVLIQDSHEDIYQSYITEHVYNYLGGSDLSNNCKTQAQNNNRF